MISFPNCKINLGLHITDKRPDGYHNLETIFYPVPLNDAFEIAVKRENTELIVTGIDLPDNSINLCVKAYNLLKQDYPFIKPVKMHLHKVIPIGAGLGGGSADGAFALKLINEVFNLNLSRGKLLEYALQLGSDCPFFIINKPSLATGRGEILEEISLDLSGKNLVIIYPQLHINTAKAFKGIVPGKKEVTLISIISKNISEWKHLLINDFEKGIFQIYPQLEKIKENLYDAGALYASMSGSGSAIYGIFDSTDISFDTFKKDYFIKQIKLS